MLSRDIFIPPLQRREMYTVLALSICLSISPSIISIFRHTFLSNHASQPLQTWYVASARGPTGHLQNSCLLPVLQFTLFSKITCLGAKSLSHFSQQPCIKATSNLVWCFGLGSFTLFTEFTPTTYLLHVLQLSLLSNITWSNA